MKQKIKSLWQNFKKLKHPKTQIKLALIFVGLATSICYAEIMAKQFADWLIQPNNQAVAFIKIPKVEAVEKIYKYNEQVPTEVIKAEIIKQAKIYNNDEQFMLKLCFCESGYDNLAKNPNSTALGAYQWLIKSWEETESFKKHKIARTDFKYNIKEAMLAIKRGEYWRWSECLDK